MNTTTTAAAVGVLSRRDLALLRAVAAGRCELLCGTHPDLLIDGRWCCDQSAAHTLAAAGLLTPTVPSAPAGARVPAALTPAGRAALTGGPQPPPYQQAPGPAARTAKNAPTGPGSPTPTRSEENRDATDPDLCGRPL